MIGLLVHKMLAAAMLRRLIGLAGVTVCPAFTDTSNEEGQNRQDTFVWTAFGDGALMAVDGR
jgi:hypothetical protein